MTGLAPRSGRAPTEGHRGFFVYRELADSPSAKHRREAPFDGGYHGVRDAAGVTHSARWQADRKKLGGGEWVYSNGRPVARVIESWLAPQAVDEVD